MKTVVLALLAAFAFAFGSVLQQKGTLEVPIEGDDPHFFTHLVRRPVWLAGAACQGSGWILQAVALDSGSLIIVQSLTTLSLVIALPLGKRFTGQQISGESGSEPRPCRRHRSVPLCRIADRGPPRRRRRHGGQPASWRCSWWRCWDGSVGVGKELQSPAPRFGRRYRLRHAVGSDQGLRHPRQPGPSGHPFELDDLRADRHRIGRIRTSPVALRTGVLAPAMASSNAVTLFGSVVFGATVFGESLSSGGARPAPALVGLGIALIGIVLLAGAKPPQATDVKHPADLRE